MSFEESEIGVCMVVPVIYIMAYKLIHEQTNKQTNKQGSSVMVWGKYSSIRYADAGHFLGICS